MIVAHWQTAIEPQTDVQAIGRRSSRNFRLAREGTRNACRVLQRTVAASTPAEFRRRRTAKTRSVRTALWRALVARQPPSTLESNVIGVIGCQADRRGSYNDHRELAGRASSASEHGLVDRALSRVRAIGSTLGQRLTLRIRTCRGLRRHLAPRRLAAVIALAAVMRRGR